MPRQRQKAPSTLYVRLSTGAVLLLLGLLAATHLQAQTFTVLHSFSGPEGDQPVAGLTMDRAGNLYGTTVGGGFTGGSCPGDGCGTVYKMSRSGSSWVLSTIYTFHGSDGFAPVANVVFGADGALYGTTGYGGTGGGGTVFKLQPPASFCHSISCPWTRTPLYDQFNLASGSDVTSPVTFDAAGNIYGTTEAGGNTQDCSGGLGCGTVFQLVKSGNTWTRNILYAFSGPDGHYPYSGVVVDPAGNAYGTVSQDGESGAGNVYELSPSGSGWTFRMLTALNDSTGTNPWAGLLQNGAGNLFGATQYEGSGNGGTVFELSPSGGGWNFNLLYSLPEGASAGGPYAGVIMDSAGNIYGTTRRGGMYGWGSVFKLTPTDGGYTYTSLHDFMGNSGTDGALPEGTLVMDANGNLYGTASDAGSHGFQCGNGCGTVWEITP